MSKRKKIILLSAMVGLLVISGVLNFVLSNNSLAGTNDDDSDLVASSFFSAYRADRDSTRTQEILYLDAIIASETSSVSAKAAAEELRFNICKVMEQELILESLIKAKGFADAIVTMSTNNINVIVNQAELESKQVAQILNILIEETGCKPANVNVIPYS